MMETVSNVIGGIGDVSFLLAFFLIQSGRIPHSGMVYLGMNLAGSVLLMLSLLVQWNGPVFILEAAWALISIYGMYKSMHPGQAQHK